MKRYTQNIKLFSKGTLFYFSQRPQRRLKPTRSSKVFGDLTLYLSSTLSVFDVGLSCHNRRGGEDTRGIVTPLVGALRLTFRSLRRSGEKETGNFCLLSLRSLDYGVTGTTMTLGLKCPVPNKSSDRIPWYGGHLSLDIPPLHDPRTPPIIPSRVNRWTP